MTNLDWIRWNSTTKVSVFGSILAHPMNAAMKLTNVFATPQTES